MIYYKMKPKYGTVRNRKKFLFFPKRINGEWYWLRNCYVTDIYTKDAYIVMNNYTDELEGYTDGWVTTFNMNEPFEA